MARSSRRSVERTHVVVRQSYYWPDWQLNFWLIIMLAAGGTLIGIFTAFVVVQSHLQLGVPWIMPYGITVGVLTVVFVLIMLGLVYQRRLLPGVVMIGSFVLAVLFLAGLIETAIQLFGPQANVSGQCQATVLGRPENSYNINTLAWLEQMSICQSWYAAFAFWIVGFIFLVYMIVLGAQVAQGTFGDG